MFPLSWSEDVMGADFRIHMENRQDFDVTINFSEEDF